MKQGDEIVCLNCGQNSFLVRKTKMDGWKKAGDYLACSSCSHIIEEISETVNPENTAACSDRNLDKLKSFLDTDDDTAGFKKLLDSDKTARKSFCRDCSHFISHPFMDRCDLHKKNVNPMDDCNSFCLKEKK